jgi:hypothetical protein
MCFLMIDIDDFKAYNDNNGHQPETWLCRITAHCLKGALRAADVASRYGGEEFCILLPQTTAAEAAVIADRIRQRVATTHFPHGKSQPQGPRHHQYRGFEFFRHRQFCRNSYCRCRSSTLSSEEFGKGPHRVFTTMWPRVQVHMKPNPNESATRVLARVAPEGFIGRTAELQKLLAQTALIRPSGEAGVDGSVAGVSELLRQALIRSSIYTSEVIPIYFALTRNETTPSALRSSFLTRFYINTLLSVATRLRCVTRH